MRINKLTVFFLLPVVLFLSACNDAEEDTATKTKTTAVKDEFEGIEVLFNEEEHFSAPNTVELLKEINICSDVQMVMHTANSIFHYWNTQSLAGLGAGCGTCYNNVRLRLKWYSSQQLFTLVRSD